MKTNRLPEIDLARFAALSGESLEHALRAYNTRVGSWPYDPVRISTADILGAATELYGAIRKPTWDQLARQIEQACKYGDMQIASNVEVGKALFDYAAEMGWKVSNHNYGRLPIGFGESVRYWSDVLVEDRDGLFIPFLDHRRSNGLQTAAANQFVFSMQNTWIREREPDYADVRLAVIRFPVVGKSRCTHVEFHDESNLLAFDELNERVRAVYEMLARIRSEKPGGTPRRRDGGDQGSFNFG